MEFRVPSAVLASQLIVLPQRTSQSSYANLAAAASVDLDFTITYSPLFDVEVFLTQAGLLRLFTRDASSGDGSTYRQVGGDYEIAASQDPRFTLTGIRVPGNFARWRLINNGSLATTTLEFHVINTGLS